MHCFSFSRWRQVAFAGRAGRRTAAAIAMLLALGQAPALHAQPSDRAREKQEAEEERSALQEKLKALKRSISRNESARSNAADALAKTEAAISEAKRSLRELEQSQQETRQRLEKLAAREAALAQTISRQQKQLADLLRRHYLDGNQDRVKLLLSGDNPNRIHRDLQYLGYLSQAQAALVESLRDNLQTVEAHRNETLAAQRELDDMADEERSQKAALDKEKTEHASLLAQLSGKLERQRREAGVIERDQQRLSGLVERLQKVIEEQRREEAAARRKREQQRELAARQKAEQAKAERERQRAAQASQAARSRPSGAAPPVNPNAIEDDEAPQQAQVRPPGGPETREADAGTAGAGAFAALRGRLAPPVQGELAARFGARRSDGPPWKGLFIRATEGSDVRTVAPGQVVFADWLRGFGNLIIIDHGGQYMTIYGNNQAVLKRAGDRVAAGDIIASAGSSGGNEQSGLYFEMRHQGRAFDPLGWITFR